MSNPKPIQEMNAEWDEWRSATFRPQWIKCAERMPEDGVPVLVWCPTGSYVAMEWGAHVAQRDGAYGWTGDVEWAHLDRTTHWQSLPEPPNE